MSRLPTAGAPADVLAHVGEDSHLILPLATGEPVEVMDALEAAAPSLRGVKVHQMHALHPRPYLDGRWSEHLRHISYFLSPLTRASFARGGCDLVPANFSEVPALLGKLRDPLVLAATSRPDRHGYVSLGTSADYVASLIGRARFFVGCNRSMPATAGRNQLHLSQVVGWCETDRPLVEVPVVEPTELDRRIAALVAERIPDGATIQAGIGGVPNAVMALLRDHRDLGVHTELMSDGLVELLEAGVVNGVRKKFNRTKAVATFGLGTRRVYEFLDGNPAVEFWPVDYVNDPRLIGREPNFVSINATLEVDLLGQCASESIGSRFYSGSGGQGDFARGAMYSEGGQGFVVLHARTRHGHPRIRPTLTPGAMVTTNKNSVDKVVTEYGVAELRGRTVAGRAAALIAVAHPEDRDELARAATRLGFLSER